MRGLWNHLGLYVAEGLWNSDMENVRYDYFFQFYVTAEKKRFWVLTALQIR